MTSKVFAAVVFVFAVPLFVSMLFLPAFVFAETPPLTSVNLPDDIQALLKKDPATLTNEEKKKVLSAINPGVSLTQPSVSAPTGSVACFDYYHFGSVQVGLSSTLAATVPGATIGFIGTIKNANTYPLVDGQVYVKIFRKGGDEALIHQNGYALVDQFALPDTFTLPAKGEKPASFAWKVPENAPTGDYMAAFFFETAKRYNLLGLSFTDDVVGNQALFSVKNSTDTGVVAFDKNSVTKNGEPHHFAAFLTKYTKDEPVTIKTKLVNPRDETVVVSVTWKLYAWDSLREETLKDTKTELVELKPKETKELSYIAQPIDASASYLVVETKDGNSKSILDIRFARDGVEETRINFPSIMDFPLKQGTETTLFSCAHSTNLPVVKDNTLTLTLRDDQGKIIHSYAYQGDITGAMMGVKDSFTPDQTYDNFTLTATLARQGKVVEEVTQKYACQDIDPSLCSKPVSNVIPGSAGRGAILAILTVITLLLGALGWKLWKGRKSGGMKAFSFLFAMLLSGAFLFGGAGEVEAKSVVWSVDGMLNNAWGYCQSNTSSNISVTYQAQVINVSTGQLITDGDIIPVGTTIHFESIPHQNQDISWFQTGTADDSPYGFWMPGITMPSPYNPYNEPAPADWAAITNGYCWNTDNTDSAIVLSVNPPVKSFAHSGTAGLSCDGAGTTCTAISPGTIQLSVVFNNTNGRFFENGLDWAAQGYPQFSGYIGEGYSFNSNFIVPIQTISFDLTTTGAGNSAPSVPILTPPAPTGTPSSLVFITATSTDPDGDTLRYGFDWDNNGTVDEWVLWVNYVASGTSQTRSHFWPTAGTYPIRVLAQDSKGSSSGWANTNITISAAAVVYDPTLSFSAFPISITSGNSSTLSWSTSNAQSCYAWGGGIDGWKVVNGSQTVWPAATTTYYIECWNSAGVSSGQQSVTVTVVAAVPVVNGGWSLFSSCSPTTCETTGTQTRTCTNPAPSGGGANCVGSATQSCANLPCCIANCSNAANYCSGTSFNDSNGCGTNNCPGTRSCDYNWKEVAP